MTSASDQTTHAQKPRAEATAAADSARNRAQSAWAISSALAGALIAGGALTNASDRPGWVQGLVLAAIVAWIVTAIWFISAVSGIDPRQKLQDASVAAWHALRRTKAFQRTKRSTSAAAAEEPAPTPLERGQADRQAIDKQLNTAYSFTVVAILLTVAALIGGVISSVAPAHIDAVVTLNQKAWQKVHDICPDASRTRIYGAVERGSLTRPFAVIVLDGGQCMKDEKKGLTLEVPPSAITAFRFQTKKEKKKYKR
jgi:hypothetical protein